MGKKLPKPANAPVPVDEIDQAVLDAVDIDPTDYEDSFKSVPRLLATYNERYARALKRHLRAYANRKRVYAQRLIALRLELQDQGEKTTEQNIKAHAEADDEYAKAVEAEINAEVEKVRLWGVLDSLRAKRDALTSIGAHLRAEMQGMPGIRGERRGARDVESNHRTDDRFDVDVEDDG